MTCDAWYALAEKCYHHYGRMKMKENFRTFDGITYDENGLNLPACKHNQKVLYKKGTLSKERMEKFDAIGLTPTTLYKKRLTWNESFALCAIYYNHYGSLNMPKDFKTINGIDYDENGYNLYNWLNNQHGLEYRFYALLRYIERHDFYDEDDKRYHFIDLEQTKEKVDKLESIGYAYFLETKKQSKKKKKETKKLLFESSFLLSCYQ